PPPPRGRGGRRAPARVPARRRRGAPTQRPPDVPSLAPVRGARTPAGANIINVHVPGDPSAPGFTRPSASAAPARRAPRSTLPPVPDRTLEKLEPVPVIETAHRLRDRIGARFPDRGIHRVAQELAALTEQVADTSADTRRRSRMVRGGAHGLIALVVLVAVIAFGFAVDSAFTEAPDNGLDWLPLIESAVNDLVFVAVAVVVLHSLP